MKKHLPGNTIKLELISSSSKYKLLKFSKGTIYQGITSILVKGKVHISNDLDIVRMVDLKDFKEV